MNGNNNFTLCPIADSYKRILLPLTYSLVFVLGLTLNGALLWVVCFRTRTWSCSVIYLTNLAVADLLYVLSLPLLIVSYAMDDVWPFGDIICKAVRFFFCTNLHCSMMFLMCISVHRFLGVCYPITALRFRTKNLAVLTSGSVWVLVMLEISPTLVFAHTGFINNMTVCYEMTNPGQLYTYFPYDMFLDVVGFLVPFMIILICYCSMMRVLYRAGRDNSQVGTENLNKSIRTILAVCLMFVLCFVPYHIARIVCLFIRVYVSSDCRVINLVMIGYKIWKPLVSFNSCANPLLYFLGSDRQRKQLWAQLFRSKMVHPTVSTVQPDIVPTVSGTARNQ
ncbi:P2Y purinoceptor 3-like [Salmo trutta]|uniref:P2Y purinoceptor 3-like n=1 Tax=Salmo trutta TaxID=8032 RepID=UPI001131CC3D|nr:P2Y purinoceptor 3-like [Salmo trutta]